MCSRRRFSIKDAGLDQSVSYTRRTVIKVLKPLVDLMCAEARARRSSPDGDRYLLALAGPPGCGKSTVAAVLQRLFTERGMRSLVLPLDGFHLKNEELKRRR